MPLPLGHFAVGITTYEMFEGNEPENSIWRVATFTAVLSNLPDIDVIVGLIIAGNGYVYHRGPTHSIIFALISALIASNLYKLCSKIPKLSFKVCFLIILSHLFADLLFTNSPVSILWPLEVHWSIGDSGWIDVVSSIFLEAYRDIGIVLCCSIVLLLEHTFDRKFTRLKTVEKKFNHRREES